MVISIRMPEFVFSVISLLRLKMNDNKYFYHDGDQIMHNMDTIKHQVISQYGDRGS